MQIKAISTVVGSILMFMIVIALGGVSYAFISGVFTGGTATAFELVDAYNDTITIRNIGTETIQDLTSVRVDENSRKDWFSDDFNDGDFTGSPVWVPLNPNLWEVSSQKLRTKVGNIKLILPAGVHFDNFIIDLKVLIKNSDNARVLIGFRTKEPFDFNNYYALFLTYRSDSPTPQPDTYGITKNIDGTSVTLRTITALPSNIDLSQENKIKIIASGSSMKFFINDNLIESIQDSTFSAGYFWISVTHAGTTFDDVKINPYMEPGGTATFKVYDPLSKGTHTVKLCTSSMCNTGYITIQ